MTEVQRKVRELYPLLVWYQAIWLLPFVAGLAGAVAVSLSQVEPIGMSIGIVASLFVSFVGVGGFTKQVVDRFETIASVVLFKDSWGGGIGNAPVAFCNHDSGADAAVVADLFRRCAADNKEPEGWTNIISDHVFRGGVLTEAFEDGRALHEYFKPITFVTVYAGKSISRGGRKFFGIAYGRWIDVVYGGLQGRSFVGLVVHEMKHRVLEQIHPHMSVGDQHAIMGADLQGRGSRYE